MIPAGVGGIGPTLLISKFHEALPHAGAILSCPGSARQTVKHFLFFIFFLINQNFCIFCWRMVDLLKHLLWQAE